MLMKISQWLISTILPDIQDEDQRLLCAYGCELWLYTIISTLGLLIMGLLMGNGLESIIIITVFYICQSNGGGFHALSHMRCFLTMAAGLLVGLLMVRMPSVQHTLTYACVVSILVLLAIPLRLHPNKQYLKKTSQQLRMHSYFATLGIAISIAAMGLFEGGSLFRAGCAATCLSAVSRLFAVKS